MEHDFNFNTEPRDVVYSYRYDLQRLRQYLPDFNNVFCPLVMASIDFLDIITLLEHDNRRMRSNIDDILFFAKHVACLLFLYTNTLCQSVH